MIRELPIDYIQPPPPPPSSSHRPKSNNLPALYYGLVVVGAAAIVLAIYNLIIIKWCTRRQRQQPRARRRPLNNGFVLEATTTASDQSFDNIMNRNLLSSFKYKRDMSIMVNTVCQGQEGHYDDECAVCLSIFEEGEDVRQLPRCKHSFHASCIDMWLYSHFDCPLCRAPIQVTRCLQVDSQSQEEHSRENLLASGTSQQAS